MSFFPFNVTLVIGNNDYVDLFFDFFYFNDIRKMRNPIKFVKPTVDGMSWFWDAENVRIPRTCSLGKAIFSVLMGQQAHNIGEYPLINMYGEKNIRTHFEHELNMFGVKCYEAGIGRNRTDALMKRHIKAWFKSKHPSYITILGGDHGYISTVKRLQERGHKVLLFGDENSTSGDLRGMADIYWSWARVLEGDFRYIHFV